MEDFEKLEVNPTNWASWGHPGGYAHVKRA
jgi:hypothetical protein